MNFRFLSSCLIFVAIGALGFQSFTSCHGNGGGLFSCGVVGFLIGLFKLLFLATVWIFVALFDGFSHLFGGG
jgi:hypothetical protein